MDDNVRDLLTDPGMKLQVHQAFSAGCFNSCWTLIDKGERSEEEDEEMVLLAEASLWHWKQRTDCLPLNLSIGYWLASRVHALAGHCDMAREHADRCLRISLDEDLPPFYKGYAYEALARSESLSEEEGETRRFLKKARRELAKVKDRQEREMLEADIASLEGSVS
ncbi:MAG: hypothetical protein AVO35_11895 [Candidatus Aegiribacteria sp. MLS_C]|nr:MAG: hypothetical protein AVO35_11895 [Candidatus Aegiribacteria sp. MLS_C]